MNHRFQTLFSVTAALGLATAAPSQQIDTTQSRVPIHTAADDAGLPYGVWAAGATYKASFHDGFTFVPLMGERVQEVQRWTWRTESIRCGGVELITGRTRAGEQAGDWRYEYDLGAAIEAYDVRTDGVEQTFVIAARPAAGHGDLVIVGRIGGTLASTPRGPEHAALTFGDGAAITAVGYGAATAVDANGARVPMTTAVDGDRLELRLSATALEGLEFPLTIDPLLTNQVFGIHTEAFDLDIYRDDDTRFGDAWVVFSTRAAANDADLYVRRFPDDFTGPGATVYSDITTSWSTQRGSVAGTAGTGPIPGRVVTVFDRDYPSGFRRVRWHAHDKDDATLIPSHGSVPFVANTNDWRPDVGGTRAQSGTTSVFVVMQRESGNLFQNGPSSALYGFELDTAAAAQGTIVGSVVEVGAGTLYDEERPTINQVAAGGSAFSWVLAWQAHDNTPSGRWTVYGRRWSITGGPASVISPLSGIALHDEITPAIAGEQGRYLVTYGNYVGSTWKPAGPGANEVAATRVDWPHGTLSAQKPYGQRVLAPAVGFDFRAGDCAFDWESASHWGVTYTRVGATVGQFRAVRIGFDGEQVEEVYPYLANGYQPYPGGMVFDEDHNRFTFAFFVDTGGASNTLWANHLTYPSAPLSSNYGTNCHAGSWLLWENYNRRGNENGAIRLVQARPLSGVFLVASTASAAIALDPYGIPGCSALVDGSPSIHLATMVQVTNANGEFNLPLPLPSQMPVFDLHLQAFVVDPNANAAGLEPTHGLLVPIR
ncbi:MAG: hypothetical protein KDE27_26160 [Planctomycetes bacterium]|nr:hypothetical protein [Planctomycetota bacterium]